jgi:hypothetical protein
MRNYGSSAGDRPRGRRGFLRTLGLLPFWTRALRGSARAQSVDVFQGGWNHPWIAYGHDFGRAWGHDGLSTSGWTVETFPTLRGFEESEVTVDPASGRGALRIHCNLSGADASRSAGAVYVSLLDHWPGACPPAPGVSVNLDGALVRCRIRLPRGSAGSPDAPNYLQLFLKTRLTPERWPSLYTPPETISRSWEDRDVDVVVRLDERAAALVEPGFDIRDVSLIGLTMTAGSPSAAVNGTIWLDEFDLDTVPQLLFDFERSEFEAQVEYVRRRFGRAFSLVRFFTFCDGRAAPTFAPDGTVVGLDDVFYRDFDVLLRAASRQGVLLMPVLLDFGWCAYPRTISGVQLGGHADVIRDDRKRRSFLDRALRPLLERYGNHPAIFAWDVCNEPEWVVDEVPAAFRDRHDVVSLDEMRAFVRSCAAYVHYLAPTQLVTLGSARRMWVPMWKECDLDLYQFHWYDHFIGEEPFPWRSYDELDLDKPCLVGEVPTAGTAFTRQEFMAAAQNGGYSGLLFWSYGARDASSDLCSPVDRRPVRSRRRRA